MTRHSLLRMTITNSCMSSHGYSVRCAENAENSKITRYFPPLPTKNLLEVTRINVCRQTKKRMINTQNNVLPKP